MAEKSQTRFRRMGRIARRLFRWVRISLLCLVLALLILAIWLNRFGLPEFIKERLVFELRSRGIELRFTRMRLIWYRGIVADNIHFGRSGETNGPRVSATEAEVHLRVRPLLHRQIDLEGVALRGGRVIIPIWGTNDRPRELAIEKVSGEVRFLPNDQWELSGFRAETFGVKLLLGGTVTNATAIRSWKLTPTRPKEKTPEAFWHDLVLQFEQTKFAPPTEIIGAVSGDARRLETFRANVNISSPSIDSPWGTGKKLTLSAQIVPQSGALIHAEIRLQAQDADTRWGRASSVQLETQLAPSLTQWTPTNAHLNLQVKRAQTPWGNAASLTIRADFRPNPSDAASALAEYSIRGQQIQTKRARFAQAELSASGVVSASNAWSSIAKTKLNFAGGEIDLVRAASGSIEASLTLPPWNVMEMADTNISWWTRVEKIAGEVTGQLADVHARELDVKSVVLGANWRSPLLALSECNVTLYDGQVRATAKLDSSTRLLTARASSDFDPQKIAPLLGTNGQRWLTNFTWAKTPKVVSEMRVTLPPWTNSGGWKDIDWSKEVAPTLSLAGNFEVGPAAYRGVPVSAAQSDFNYSNRTWWLPDLLVTRPEGQARMAYSARVETGEFQYIIDSGVDFRVLRPLLDPPVQRVLDEFTLTTPPIIHAEITGQWHALEQMTVRAKFAVTNAGYRQRAVQSCRTLVTLTNQVLSFVAPEVVRTEGMGSAESVVIDIPRKKLFINHAAGALNVADVTHAIGPAVEKTMEPYHFFEAPPAQVHGFVDLENELGSDLRFTVAAGAFEWRSFRFQQITGDVHWAGTALTLSNVVGSMHGGSVEMSAAFDFAAKEGTDFAFRTLAHGINFHSLMTDLSSPTNKLEGTLSGLLVVTNANTDRARSWFGFGNATLQDGLIWDVPALGFFSPILNKLKPGSGNNRAREVAATFTITNSVITTSDLQIHASGMVLNYNGTVDFDTRINGRVEAELLRDMPGLGPVVSKVLWPMTKLFEYKVAGTLGKPKAQPVFIPKVLMMPFHPLRTLRELIESDKEDSAK